MISVLILTKNEEQDLPGCLASVDWSNDVHVFDSHSTDATVEVARRAGAKVTARTFDGYASQRNAALTQLNYRNEWILILDADERIPAELHGQLVDHVAGAGPGTGAFRFRRRDYLFGTWLKRSQISPYYIRLVRVGRARYHREINEVLEIDGEVVDIDGHFDHFPFSKGIRHWVDKHNAYSSMEAARWLEEEREGIAFSWRKAFFGRDFNLRRYHQKGLFYKLPGRPFIKWAYMMFVRRGVLDGRAGWSYAALQAIYEYFIVLKYRELKTNHSH